MIICACRRILLIHRQRMRYSFYAFDPGIRHLDTKGLEQLGNVSRVLIGYNKLIANCSTLPSDNNGDGKTLVEKLLDYEEP